MFRLGGGPARTRLRLDLGRNGLGRGCKHLFFRCFATAFNFLRRKRLIHVRFSSMIGGYPPSIDLSGLEGDERERGIMIGRLLHDLTAYCSDLDAAIAL